MPQVTPGARRLPRPRQVPAKILAALVLGWAIFGVADVSRAASIKTHHFCPCGMNCKGASCCCPGDEPVAETASAVAEPVSSGRSSPPSACLGTAPCGGGESPASPPGASPSKAALKPVSLLSHQFPGVPVFSMDPPGPPSTVSSRLDDPPEGVL